MKITKSVFPYPDRKRLVEILADGYTLAKNGRIVETDGGGWRPSRASAKKWGAFA